MKKKSMLAIVCAGAMLCSVLGGCTEQPRPEQEGWQPLGRADYRPVKIAQEHDAAYWWENYIADASAVFSTQYPSNPMYDQEYVVDFSMLKAIRAVQNQDDLDYDPQSQIPSAELKKYAQQYFNITDLNGYRWEVDIGAEVLVEKRLSARLPSAEVDEGGVGNGGYGITDIDYSESGVVRITTEKTSEDSYLSPLLFTLVHRGGDSYFIESVATAHKDNGLQPIYSSNMTAVAAPKSMPFSRWSARYSMAGGRLVYMDTAYMSGAALLVSADLSQPNTQASILYPVSQDDQIFYSCSSGQYILSLGKDSLYITEADLSKTTRLQIPEELEGKVSGDSYYVFMRAGSPDPLIMYLSPDAGEFYLYSYSGEQATMLEGPASSQHEIFRSLPDDIVFTLPHNLHIYLPMPGSVYLKAMASENKSPEIEKLFTAENSATHMQLQGYPLFAYADGDRWSDGIALRFDVVEKDASAIKHSSSLPCERGRRVYPLSNGNALVLDYLMQEDGSLVHRGRILDPLSGKLVPSAALSSDEAFTLTIPKPNNEFSVTFEFIGEHDGVAVFHLIYPQNPAQNSFVLADLF